MKTVYLLFAIYFTVAFIASFFMGGGSQMAPMYSLLASCYWLLWFSHKKNKNQQR